MVDPVSKRIRKAAADLVEFAQIPGGSIADWLNGFLNSFLVWPFRASSGLATDHKGRRTSQFGTVVYTSSPAIPTTVPLNIRADLLACAIDVSESIGIEELRGAHERIAVAKQLRKSITPQTPSGVPVADATLGIIFAVHSAVPIEKLAEELEQLNAQRPFREWPDMIVILSRGTINLVCQMPEMPLADFLPPAGGDFLIAPMYVHTFAKPDASFSLNRMCALLFMYLQIFSPGTVLPNMRDVLEGAPKVGLIIGAYQFNLSRELAPVPMELRFNRFLFPVAFRAEDANGNLVSKVHYLPWQDGGVLHVTGKLPLEAILVFAGNAAKGAHRFRLHDGEISNVLPISEAEFREMAQRLAAQSNLIIKPEAPRWVLTKIADEGTSTPFIARLYAGMLRLRDQTNLSAAQREEFDRVYAALLPALNTARTAAKAAVEVFASHSRRVSQGEVVRVTVNSIQVNESVDAELRKQVESFISSAGRAFKDRMQEVMKSLGVNISFLYQQQKTFDPQVAALRQRDPALADYLQETRVKWSERLSECRNALEHEGWTLPTVRYFEGVSGVRAIEPEIDGQLMSEFVTQMFDRVCCFVEELCTFGLQAHMDARISITEIPLSQRKPEFPERFQNMLVGGGMPIWMIRYHYTRFEDT